MASTAQQTLTARRQSKLRFLDSTDSEEGDYECMICYAELEPNSGLTQTACCLKLACTGCMMKAFYHSLMARDSAFKCPMCRGIIVEVPEQPVPPTINHNTFVAELAGNLDSMDEADEILPPEENFESWYIEHIERYGPPRRQFNAEIAQLRDPVYTDSTSRFTTWSNVYGRITISFFTGAPHTILIRYDNEDRVTRWHYDDWEIACIGVTPYMPRGDDNQPIFITIISKPIDNGQNHSVIIRELTTDITVTTNTIPVYHNLPVLDHKATMDFNLSYNQLRVMFGEIASNYNLVI